MLFNRLLKNGYFIRNIKREPRKRFCYLFDLIYSNVNSAFSSHKTHSSLDVKRETMNVYANDKRVPCRLLILSLKVDQFRETSEDHATNSKRLRYQTSNKVEIAALPKITYLLSNDTSNMCIALVKKSIKFRWTD